MTRSIAIICGLKSEAAVIGRALAALNVGERAGVWVTGANAQRAEDMARLAIAEDNAACVLSIGISGALSPDLMPGDLLIGECVRTISGEEFACDGKLAEALFAARPAHPGESRYRIRTSLSGEARSALSRAKPRQSTPPTSLPLRRAGEGGGARGETSAYDSGASRDPDVGVANSRLERGEGMGPCLRRERGRVARTITQAVLLGSDVIVDSAAEKERLYDSTGAIAVDMESHAVGRAAKAAGVAFAAIRAIADPAQRALPKAALGAVAPDGSTRVLSTLLRCAKAPAEFPALLQLGSDSNKALKALGRDLGGLLGALLLALDL